MATSARDDALDGTPTADERVVVDLRARAEAAGRVAEIQNGSRVLRQSLVVFYFLIMVDRTQKSTITANSLHARAEAADCVAKI